MPFVPFKKHADADRADATAAAGAPSFSKSFGKKRKRKTGQAAPAQKALMNPGGRSLAGGGR